MNIADEAAGKLATKILKGLKGLPDSFLDSLPVIVDALDTAGFVVEQNVAVDYWGCERGRVNIVAFHKSGKVAIELDRRSARARSAAKLRSLDAYRIIALRGEPDLAPKRVLPSYARSLHSIHQVVGLSVEV